ncbi:MAG: helix-turn-helix transcriptional regulator [Candidatus Hydrogenedentes bacterium]|nr:helix-turn-helix transcriptional regulator [Candidatus Hydrogenedentota bacterium]
MKLRNEKGLSSVQLAKMTGLSRGYLWQLENGGKANPSLDILQKLARALGVSVAEFGRREGALLKTERAPKALQTFFEQRGKELGVLQSDVDAMKEFHFRRKQPTSPEDYELLFLFLKKLMK